MAAPVIAASAGYVESAGTSFSHAFDRGSGSNAMLVVCIQNQSASDNVNAPTFNGVAFTLLYKRQNANAQTPTWNHYYGLVAPASGSNTLALTTTSSCAPFWFVYSLTGAKQTGQPDSSNGVGDASSNSAFAVTLTTVVADCLLIGMSSDNNGNMAAGANTTKRSSWLAGYGLQIFDSNSAAGSAGSRTLNVTGSNGGKSDFTAVGIAPGVQNITMTAAQGSFTFTGYDANMTKGKGFAAAVGIFALTGFAATLTSVRTMTAAQGSFALTGYDVTFRAGKGFQADVGLFTLTGFPVTFGGTGSWKWTHRTKPTSIWTDRSKP